MKYTYDIRVSESEARQLEIILQEPIKDRRPKSTAWETITTPKQTLLAPALFIGTKKTQWTMFPSFEWKTTIFLDKPIATKNTYLQIVKRRILPIDGHPQKALLEIHANSDPLSLDFIKTSNCLVWNNRLKEFRSYDEKTRN